MFGGYFISGYLKGFVALPGLLLLSSSLTLKLLQLTESINCRLYLVSMKVYDENIMQSVAYLGGPLSNFVCVRLWPSQSHLIL